MSANESMLVPHSPDAEKAVLSCLLHAPREVFDLCAESNLISSWFFIPSHRDFWEALSEGILSGTPHDSITLAQHFRDKGKLEAVGGPGAVVELYTFLGTAANAGHYIGILKEQSQRRELMAFANRIHQRCADGTDAGEIIAKAHEDFGEILGRASSKATARLSTGPLIEFLSPSQLSAYIPPDGARLVGDFHVTRGAVFVIGGAPGVGKSRALTALAVSGATGAPWLGLPLHRKFKTMIVQNENGRFRLKTEFAGVDCAALDDWVRVCPPPPRGLCFSRIQVRDQLAAAIAEFNPDVVGLDPWNAAAPNDQAKDYLETFEIIRSVIPAGDDAPALGIVAHTRKPKADERASGRGLLNLLAGSYVLGSVPRSVFVMQAATDSTDDSRVVWTCCKNNDGEMGTRSAWNRSNGQFSPAEGFDWDSFDNAGRDKAPKHKAVVEIVRNASSPLTKAAIVAKLKERGIPQPTAYRWLDSAEADGSIALDKITGTYRASSQSDSH